MGDRGHGGASGDVQRARLPHPHDAPASDRPRVAAADVAGRLWLGHLRRSRHPDVPAVECGDPHVCPHRGLAPRHEHAHPVVDGRHVSGVFRGPADVEHVPHGRAVGIRPLRGGDQPRAVVSAGRLCPRRLLGGDGAHGGDRDLFAGHRNPSVPHRSGQAQVGGGRLCRARLRGPVEWQQCRWPPGPHWRGGLWLLLHAGHAVQPRSGGADGAAHRLGGDHLWPVLRLQREFRAPVAEGHPAQGQGAAFRAPQRGRGGQDAQGPDR